MSLWNERNLLGADDYQDEDDNSLNQYLNPPAQGQYYPLAQPQQSAPAPSSYAQQAPQMGGVQPSYDYSQQSSPMDVLDEYDQFQTQQKYIEDDARVFKDDSAIWEQRYDDFVKNKFKPFYSNFDIIDEVVDDQDYITHLDNEYARLNKVIEDGDDDEFTHEQLKAFGPYGGSNGLKAQFEKLKYERDTRKAKYDEVHAQSVGMLDQLTNLPPLLRAEMDKDLKERKKPRANPRSKKVTDELLDSLHFEDPLYWNGQVMNPDKIDPREKLSPIVGSSLMADTMNSPQVAKQNKRMDHAMRGEVDQLLGQRSKTDKYRKLRQSGQMFSMPNNTSDGRTPRKLSDKHGDILDMDRMLKAGMHEYNGKPLAEMMSEMGGQEELALAKIMSAVYDRETLYRDAQIAYLTNHGKAGAAKFKKKMDVTRDAYHMALKLAQSRGLEHEIFEQSESPREYMDLSGAAEKGWLQMKQAWYAKDILTKSLDHDQIADILELQKQIDKVPTSTAMERYMKMSQEDPAEDVLEAAGRLIFDNPAAGLEIFVNSMSSFLPTSLFVGVPAALGGMGAKKMSGGNVMRGGRYGLATGFAMGSLALEATGSTLQSMQELGVNYKDPKVFGAAWNNERLSNDIVSKAAKRGVAIGALDGMGALFMGRVAATTNHLSRSIRGAKLLDEASWATSKASVPRFSKYQRIKGPAMEVGFDMGTGMLGETLAQGLTKESGERWDYDSIAAEGVLGMGPGAIGAAFEYRASNPANVAFDNAPFQYSDVQATPDGTKGTITRGGWKHEYQTFNNADSMTNRILNASGIDNVTDGSIANTPKAMHTQDWIARMYSANPEAMSNMRVVFADRTPAQGGGKIEGGFQTDGEGNGVLYLNQKMFQEHSPIGVFMHESGHMARVIMFPVKEEFYDIYESIPRNERLEAFAAYHTGNPVPFESLSESQQKDIVTAFDSTSPAVKAEEWFAFQWAGVLAGRTAADGTVNTALKQFLKAHVEPYMAKWMGDANLATGEQSIRLQQQVLNMMGYSPSGLPMTTTGVNFNAPNMRAPGDVHLLEGLNEQEGLNALVNRIADMAREDVGNGNVPPGPASGPAGQGPAPKGPAPKPGAPAPKSAEQREQEDTARVNTEAAEAQHREKMRNTPPPSAPAPAAEPKQQAAPQASPAQPVTPESFAPNAPEPTGTPPVQASAAEPEAEATPPPSKPTPPSKPATPATPAPEAPPVEIVEPTEIVNPEHERMRKYASMFDQFFGFGKELQEAVEDHIMAYSEQEKENLVAAAAEELRNNARIYDEEFRSQSNEALLELRKKLYARRNEPGVKDTIREIEKELKQRIAVGGKPTPKPKSKVSAQANRDLVAASNFERSLNLRTEADYNTLKSNQKRFAEIRSTLLDSKKFEESYDKAIAEIAEENGIAAEEVSIAAIVNKVLDFEALQKMSKFGSEAYGAAFVEQAPDSKKIFGPFKKRTKRHEVDGRSKEEKEALKEQEASDERLWGKKSTDRYVRPADFEDLLRTTRKEAEELLGNLDERMDQLLKERDRVTSAAKGDVSKYTREVNARIANLKTIRDQMFPEQATIDWKDVEHPFLKYQIQARKKGSRYTRNLDAEEKKHFGDHSGNITLGQMAEYGKLKPQYIESGPKEDHSYVMEIGKFTKGRGRWVKLEQSDTQDALYNLYDNFVLEESKKKKIGYRKGGKKITAEEMQSYLLAARASFHEQQGNTPGTSTGPGMKPMGYVHKGKGGKEVSAKTRRGSVTADEGANIIAFAIERVHQMDKDRREKAKAQQPKVESQQPKAESQQSKPKFTANLGSFEEMFDQLKSNPQAVKLNERYKELEQEEQALKDSGDFEPSDQAGFQQGFDALYESMARLIEPQQSKADEFIDTEEGINLDTISEYKGLKVELVQEAREHPVHKEKSVASRKDDTIYLHRETVDKAFKDKQWTKPRVKGITPLAEDSFSTPEEFVGFLLEHELQHQNFPSIPKSKDKMAEYIANENAINKAAARELGIYETAYPYRSFLPERKGVSDGDSFFGQDHALDRTELAIAYYGAGPGERLISQFDHGNDFFFSVLFERRMEFLRKQKPSEAVVRELKKWRTYLSANDVDSGYSSFRDTKSTLNTPIADFPAVQPAEMTDEAGKPNTAINWDEHLKQWEIGESRQAALEQLLDYWQEALEWGRPKQKTATGAYHVYVEHANREIEALQAAGESLAETNQESRDALNDLAADARPEEKKSGSATNKANLKKNLKSAFAIELPEFGEHTIYLGPLFPQYVYNKELDPKVDQGIDIREFIPGADKWENVDIGQTAIGGESTAVADLYDKDGKLKDEFKPKDGEELTVETHADGRTPETRATERSAFVFNKEIDAWVHKGFKDVEAVGAQIEAINKAWEEKMDKRASGAQRSDYLISPQQLAEYVLTYTGMLGNRGFNASRLGDIPSSKAAQPSPGGPAQGLLPVVWYEVMAAMYDQLGLDKNTLHAKNSVTSKKAINWKTDATQARVGGEMTKPDLQGQKISETTIANDLGPILQAVIDAKRLDLFKIVNFKSADSTVDEGSQGQGVMTRDMRDNDAVESANRGEEELKSDEESTTSEMEEAPTDEALVQEDKETKAAINKLDPKAIKMLDFEIGGQKLRDGPMVKAVIKAHNEKNAPWNKYDFPKYFPQSMGVFRDGAPSLLNPSFWDLLIQLQTKDDFLNLRPPEEPDASAVTTTEVETTKAPNKTRRVGKGDEGTLEVRTEGKFRDLEPIESVSQKETVDETASAKAYGKEMARYNIEFKKWKQKLYKAMQDHPRIKEAIEGLEALFDASPGDSGLLGSKRADDVTVIERLTNLLSNLWSSAKLSNMPEEERKLRDSTSRMFEYLKQYGITQKQSDRFLFDMLHKEVQFDPTNPLDSARAIAEPLSYLMSHSQHFENFYGEIFKSNRFKKWASKKYNEGAPVFSKKTRAARFAARDFFRDMLTERFSNKFIEETGIERSFFDKIIAWVKQLVNLLSDLDMKALKRMNKAVDNTAAEVFEYTVNGKPVDIFNNFTDEKGIIAWDPSSKTTVKPEEMVELKFEEAVKQSKIANYVIRTLATKFPDKFSLTGSLAYATQGKVMRRKSELVHDLDYHFYGDEKELAQILADTFGEQLVLKNVIPAEDAKGDQYSTQQYEVVTPDLRVALEGDLKYKADVRVHDKKTGKQIGPNEADGRHMHLDFFIHPSKKPDEIFAKLGKLDVRVDSWKTSFEAKNAWGRLKDVFDYSFFTPEKAEPEAKPEAKPEPTVDAEAKPEPVKDWPVTTRPLRTDELDFADMLLSTTPDAGTIDNIARIARMIPEGDWNEAKWDKMLSGKFGTNWIDQSRPVKRLHDAVIQAAGIKPGTAMFDTLQVWRKWHAYYGQGYKTMEDFNIKFYEPIMEAMRKHGISQPEFGRYLIARRAPSMNEHYKRQHEDRINDLAEKYPEKDKDGSKDQKEYKMARDTLEKEGPSFSGMHTEDAVAVVREMESDTKFLDFLQDEINPLQKIYDMNKDALDKLGDSEMIDRSDVAEGDRMVTAASYHDWHDASIYKSKVNLTDNRYSYVPMQGFEGELNKLEDRETAFDILGKTGKTAGKGWDQPKMKFMKVPATGRNPDGKVYAPDPEQVMATAFEQYNADVIRSHKNTVSQSFGALFNFMRAIAHHDTAVKGGDGKETYGKLYLDSANTLLPKSELMRILKDDAAREAIRKEFDATFEVDFEERDVLKQYEWEETTVKDEDGNDIKKPDGKRMKIMRKALTTKFRDDPYTFVYRELGTPVFIKIKQGGKGNQGEFIAAAIKNLNHQGLPNILDKFNTVTRGMAKVYTSANPMFIIPNWVRDTFTAAIHLSTADKKDMFTTALNFKTIWRHAKAVAKAEREIGKGIDPLGGKNLSTDMDSAKIILQQMKSSNPETRKKAFVAGYQFAKQAGAKVGYFRHDTVIDEWKNINKELKKGKAPSQRTGRRVGNILNAMNSGVENSIRMSTFWAAIEKGRSIDEATSLARNVTVDFNQKGNFTQTMGSLYVFFGAAVNSTDRLVKHFMERSPKERAALVGAMVGAGMLTSIFNRLFDDPDEDEDRHDFDTINPFIRDTNFTMGMPSWFPGNEKTPGMRDTGYFKVPLPLGYNFFWAVGQVAGDIVCRQTMGNDRIPGGLASDSMRLITAFSNATNPLGADGLTTMILPSSTKPFAQLWANKDYMGRPIKYEKNTWEAAKPGHMSSPYGTSKHWDWISGKINSALGGNDQVMGTFIGDPAMSAEEASMRWDVSGSQIQHLLYNFGGGPAQLADAALAGLFRPFQPEPFEMDYGNLPIVSRFAKTSTYGSSIRRDYRAIRESVETVKSEMKAMEAKKVPNSVYQKQRKIREPILKLEPLLKVADKEKNKYSRLKKKIEGSTTFTDQQKIQRVEEIERKELKLMIRINKKAKSLGYQVGP